MLADLVFVETGLDYTYNLIGQNRDKVCEKIISNISRVSLVDSGTKILEITSTFLNGIVFGTILLEKAWKKNINCFKKISFLNIHILTVTCSFHVPS